MLTLSSHAYIRNIIQLHFIHLRVQIHSFRGIVHGASGLTYKYKQEPQAHKLELLHNGYNQQPVRRPIHRQDRTGDREITQGTQRSPDEDHLLHRHGRERSNLHAHGERVPRVGATQGEDGDKNGRNGSRLRHSDRARAARREKTMTIFVY